jgi:phosphatidylserine decarboxylase
MLTKYGYDNAIPMLLIGFSVIFFAALFLKGYASVITISIGAIIVFFTLWFFRDPERVIPQQALHDSSVLIAPADGKVVEIKETEELEFIKGKAIQISIFLSPLDVHVNRSPVSGTVDFYRYMQGEYLVAWHPKSSELNEQSRIGITNPYGKVFFKQITGVLARRIVCTVQKGQVLSAGEKIGMMKFGSRMDILVPFHTDIKVVIGQTVRGAESILAILPK